MGRKGDAGLAGYLFAGGRQRLRFAPNGASSADLTTGWPLKSNAVNCHSPMKRRSHMVQPNVLRAFVCLEFSVGFLPVSPDT